MSKRTLCSTLLVACLALEGLALAESPVERRAAPDRLLRGDQQTGIDIYRAKTLTTTETLVRAFRAGKIVALRKKDGKPLRYESLAPPTRKKFDRALREFGRAIMPSTRRPTRAVVIELVDAHSSKETHRFDFDPDTGETRLHLDDRVTPISIEFNAFRLGAAVAAGGNYLAADASRLAP